MRFIKLAVYSIVILFVLVTLISLLFPSVAKVSRAVDINASTADVYQQINNMGRWPLWLKGIQTYHLLSKDSSGTGAIAEVEGSKVLIIRNTADSIVTEWIGARGGKQTGVFVFIRQPNNITTVQWYFEQKIGWLPWEKLGSMFNEKILGQAMENNLEGLKQVAEKQER
jgi:uncharacterized membrane protein